MKKLVVLVAASLVAATTAVLGQGTIVVANSAAVNGFDAPVYDWAASGKMHGPVSWAQVYAGPTADSLTPQGSPVNFLTGVNAGFIPAQTIVVNSVPPGANVYVLLTAWWGPAGSTYESTFGRYLTGYSNTVGPFVTGGAGSPPSPPPNVTGLRSFSVTDSPEPSTYAMVLIGAGALLLRRIGRRQES